MWDYCRPEEPEVVAIIRRESALVYVFVPVDAIKSQPGPLWPKLDAGLVTGIEEVGNVGLSASILEELLLPPNLTSWVPDNGQSERTSVPPKSRVEVLSPTTLE